VTEAAALRLAPSWVDANQRYLAAELAVLRARLDALAVLPPAARAKGGARPRGAVRGAAADRAAAGPAPALAAPRPPAPARELAEARAEMPGPPAIDTVAEAFGLSPFERAVLLLCAGVEMDGKLAATCAALAAVGGNAGAAVTFGLALAALEAPHWSALVPSGALRRWKLIELDPAAPVTRAALRIDERILHALAGVSAIDARLRPVLRAPTIPALLGETQAAQAEALVRSWRASDAAGGGEPSPWGASPLLHLHGEDADGQEDVAAIVAAAARTRLYALAAEDVPSGAAELDALATIWNREAVLLDGALLVRCRDGVPPAVAALAERVAGPLFVGSRDAHRWRRPVLTGEIRKPPAAEQARLWRAALVAAGAPPELDGGAAIDLVATQLRLSARGIAGAAATVARQVADGAAPAGAVAAVCRASGRHALDELAERIDAPAAWDDLVLPEGQRALLRQIAGHVRQRARVYHDWGFGRDGDRGLGVTALFAGESGTGKTMAAGVLAAALGLDLYRIDLSAVVSKYIGETEKNLRRLFDAAEDSGAVLLFDEADALFGKRSDVKDSHDRYANIEVSYLLQRMEAYRGLAILTTNLKSALDPAFHRRLRFIVQFPFPDEGHREAIWRRAFPAAAPTEGIDFRKLARLHVAGGAIRNIAVNAAFLAAEDGRPVGMAHLQRAAHAESAKTDRPLGAAETRGWT
jgi:hypothetical protein